MPKKGGYRKKKRTHVEEKDDEDDYVPKSFIIKRGKVSKHIAALITDMRNCMYPNTAIKLREHKKNALKDFLSVSSMYGITHMCIFTSTLKSNYLRLVKNPTGPTITFKINSYTLNKDIVGFNQEYKRKNKIFAEKFLTAPLLVMSGFSGLEQNDSYKLVTYMLQSMFPPLNVEKIELDECKRVVLFHLITPEDGGLPYIEYRHYALHARQRDVNRGIKRLVNKARIPNLSKVDDIADFILGKAQGYVSSESEADDLPNSKVELAQDFQGKKKSSNVALRLYEVGPRMKLELLKIEEGFLGGNVVYHQHVQKTAGEKLQQERDVKKKRALKETRKKEQEENIMRKQQELGINSDDEEDEEVDDKTLTRKQRAARKSKLDHLKKLKKVKFSEEQKDNVDAV
jgi:ribosome biogenesis protein SSF1/2